MMRDYLILKPVAPAVTAAQIMRKRVDEARRVPFGVSHYTVLLRLQGGCCFYCYQPIKAKPFRPRNNPTGYTLDHVWPLSRGGAVHGNIVLSCHRCNTAKSDRMPTALEVAAARQLWTAFRHVFPSPETAHLTGGRVKVRPSSLLPTHHQRRAQ